MATSSSTSQLRDFTSVTHPLPRSSYPTPLTFQPSDFKRLDESPDTSFYATPRFVHHIDNNAIALLKSYYSDTIYRSRQNGRPASVLDLCSSWTSHLPDSLLPRADDGPRSQFHGKGEETAQCMLSCIGVGLNEKELAANKHLTSFIVQDLNTSSKSDTLLSKIADREIDIAICSVSIDYLTQPLAVLAEVRRVLRPGGTAHCAFSDRCFPTKVIRRWLRMGDDERRKWVGGYFWADGGWEEVEEVILNEGGPGDPLFVVRARKSGAEE